MRQKIVRNFFSKKLLELGRFLKEPILNIRDLTQIHSDKDVLVPDPGLLTSSHNRLEGPAFKKRRLGGRKEASQGITVFEMPSGLPKSSQQLVEIPGKVKPEI